MTTQDRPFDALLIALSGNLTPEIGKALNEAIEAYEYQERLIEQLTFEIDMLQEEVAEVTTWLNESE